MLAILQSISPTASNNLPAIGCHLAVTAGFAVVNHIINIRLSSIFNNPGKEELSSPHAALHGTLDGLQWRSLQVAKAPVYPSTVSKGPPTPTYPHQEPFQTICLKGLIFVVFSVLITCAIVLGSSVGRNQPPSSVQSGPAPTSTSTSSSNSNQTPHQRSTTPADDSIDSDRTPPHFSGSHGGDEITKKQVAPPGGGRAQGGSPPPSPPPPPPSTQDENGGFNKGNMDWIFVLLLLPALIMLLRRLLAGSQPVIEDAPDPLMDEEESLLTPTIAEPTVADRTPLPQATCANITPWHDSSVKIKVSAPDVNSTSSTSIPLIPPVTFPSPVEEVGRNIWGFCGDLFTFLMSCALACGAFLWYLNLGLGEQGNVRQQQPRVQVLMIPRAHLPEAADESWQDIKKEETEGELPGENSMLDIIIEESIRKTDPRCAPIESVQTDSASSSNIIVSAAAVSPPSRAKLNHMAKTFVPKRVLPLSPTDVIRDKTTVMPAAIDQQSVAEESDNVRDTLKPPGY